MNITFFSRLFAFILTLSLILFTGFQGLSVQASTTDGTIDPNSLGNKYAWSDNAGWINFGTGATAGDIHITSAGITGYAWSANFGWINMAPTGSGVMVADDGTLSGSAWGENTGYIDFSGVAIQADGFFTGTATGAIVGSLTFDCSNCAVETDFRPVNARGGGGSRRLGLVGSGLGLDTEGGDQDEDQDQDEEVLHGAAEVESTDETPDDTSEDVVSSGTDRERFDNEGAVDEEALLPSGAGEERAGEEVPVTATCGAGLIDLADDPEEEAIRFLVDAGFFLCPGENFRPTDPVTRADAIKLNALGLGIESETLDQMDWWSGWQQELETRGILKGGIAPARYEPKADFLAFVLKTKGYNIENLPRCEQVRYMDVMPDAWYCSVVELAQQKGWLVDEVLFDPYGLASRSWVAGVIYRAFFLYPFGQNQ